MSHAIAPIWTCRCQLPTAKSPRSRRCWRSWFRRSRCRRRPGLIKLPLEFDGSGRERRLVEAALRAGAARLVVNVVLEREIVDVFSAIASRRVSLLACVPPSEARCEPRAVVDALLLLLHLEGLQPETAVELVGRVAPVVIQTERLMDGQHWRVARIFSIAQEEEAG